MNHARFPTGIAKTSSVEISSTQPSNAELKDLLETGLKIFQGHEQHAERVPQSLKWGRAVATRSNGRAATLSRTRRRRETRIGTWRYQGKGVGRVTLDHTGGVDYFCRFHPNMTGRISVAP